MAIGIGEKGPLASLRPLASLGPLALALALLLPALAGAEPTVRLSATVDRHEISLDEQVTLTVTLMVAGGKAEQLQLPPTPDFQVVSRSQSEQTSFSFGTGGTGRQRVRTFEMRLQPLREGDLRIEAGSVVVEGVRHRTDPITIRVRGGAADEPVVAAAPRGGGHGDVFIQATVDKEQAVVGEQILLAIHLLARVDIRNVGSLQLPKLDGFWIGDIASPTQLSARMQTVDGVPYRSYLLSKKALFPLREGRLEIAPTTVELTTHSFPSSRSQTLRRASEAIVVEVSPLPAEGVPPGASVGGVGRFALSLTAQPARVRVGDPIHVRITASGEGNLGALQLPSLPPIEGLRAFEPTTTEVTDLSSGRYGGSKSAEVLLVAEQEGTYTLPSLDWITFHPGEGRYVTARTPPRTLVVEGGGVIPPPGGGQATGAPPAPPSIRDAGSWEKPRPWSERGWFGWALALPALAALAVGLGPGLLGRWRESDGRRGRLAGRSALRALARLEGAPPAAAADEGIQVLHGYLGARLGVPTHGMQREALLAALEEVGASDGAREELSALLEAWARWKYAPPLGAGEEARLVSRAREWIRLLEAEGLGRGR